MDIRTVVQVTFELWAALTCIVLAVCIMLQRQMVSKANRIFIWMESLLALLLISDALAWIFRGRPGDFERVIVTISNFFVFALFTVLFSLYHYYLELIIVVPKKLKKLYHSFYYVMMAFFVSYLLNIKYGFYYRIDENNLYGREPLFWVCHLPFIIGLVVDGFIVIRNRKQMSRGRFFSMMGYIVLPAITLVIQTFFYGISLNNIACALASVWMYIEAQRDYDREMVRKEEEILRLQNAILLSQIKPHFLYNTLNTIYYLCGHDAIKAQKAVGFFADYLRGNLSSINKTSSVLFETELNHISNYLKLEKLRFEDRLNVVYDTKVLDFMVPSLSIQPLVENAVKHGIGKKKEGGTIYISTEENASHYFVRIKDDGVGFDMDMLAEIERKSKEDATSVGIMNVKQRIESQVGGKIEITSEKGKGTTAVVTIPKKKKE